MPSSGVSALKLIHTRVTVTAESKTEAQYTEGSANQKSAGPWKPRLETVAVVIHLPCPRVLCSSLARSSEGPSSSLEQSHSTQPSSSDLLSC